MHTIPGWSHKINRKTLDAFRRQVLADERARGGAVMVPANSITFVLCQHTEREGIMREEGEGFILLARGSRRGS